MDGPRKKENGARKESSDRRNYCNNIRKTEEEQAETKRRGIQIQNTNAIWIHHTDEPYLPIVRQ